MTPIVPSSTESQLATQIRNNIASVTSAPIESLVQVDRLGQELGFQDARPMLERTYSLLRTLSSADLSLASQTKLQALLGLVNDVLQHLQQFRSFSPQNAGPNPKMQRDNLISNLRTIYDRLFDAVAGVLPLAEPGRLEHYEAEAKASAEGIKAFFEEQQQQFGTVRSKIEKEITDTLGKAKQAAEQAGITRHEALFRSEANEHRTMARYWLIATAALAFATGLLAWINYSRSMAVFSSLASEHARTETPVVSATVNTSVAVQLALAKLIAFSLLFSAVLWAGRIYRAHRHNYVVNKHRQNALSTFEAFAKATEGDTATKNAVLLQATQCIFSPQTTGYLSQEKESEGSTQILEVIRGVASGKS